MPDERPFFVIGQWSGPGLTVWDVHEAPGDPDEFDAAYVELREDAWDAFGGIEVVRAASAAEAETAAHHEAAQTAERISRDMARQREQRSTAAPRPRRKVRHRYA